MIAENRDPAFWRSIIEHPAVVHVTMGLPFEIGEIIAAPSVLPLATKHGGFLFCRLDGFGRVVELHTMFTPEGRGRALIAATWEAFAIVFRTAQVVTTYEVEGWTAPPLSHGWKAAGPFEDSPIGPVRSWVLTREAWEQSPARKRMH